MITSDINLAIESLKKGNVIAIPTETVYGLAGNAFEKSSVNKIFKIKNRPSFNPLIVHIPNPKYINKIAQKVGEEAVETIIEAKDDNTEQFLNESADLLFHLLVLLQAKRFKLNDIERILLNRKK